MPSEKIPCKYCEKLYSPRGMGRHLNSCPKNPNAGKPGSIKKKKKSKKTKTTAQRLLDIEDRLDRIEKSLNIPSISGKKLKSISDFKTELINVINSHQEIRVSRNNYPLVKIKEIFLSEYDITLKYFEKNIHALNQQKVIELQPGGNPREYGIYSPHGKKYYYLILKDGSR